MITFLVGLGCFILGLFVAEVVTLIHINMHLKGESYCAKCEGIWPGSYNSVKK